jgi:hypothetical protein
MKDLKTESELFCKLPDPQEVAGGLPELERMVRSINDRNFKYPLSQEELAKEEGVVKDLYSKGWSHMPGLVTDKIDVLDSIKDKLDYHLDKGEGIKYGLNKDSGLPQSEARDKELFMAVANPLYKVPEIAEFLFLDKIVDIAKGFFKCTPAAGTMNLRKSFANDLPPDQTNFYHCDKNTPWILKFFLYLNDVDTVDDGPFTYIEGSAFEKPRNWITQHRWPDKTIEQVYGKERVKHLTAKKGDLLTAVTSGFHKGQKVKSRDRSLLTLNFVCCQEDWSCKPQVDIRAETFYKLPTEKRPLADYLYVAD